MPYLANIVDDCAIYSKDVKEHRRNVREFLTRCQEKQISLNPDKMQISQSTVRFGGFDLHSNGYSLSEDIFKAIAKFPKPDSRRTFRAYHGLVQQLASSNKNVTKTLEPMRGLLSTANEFLWTPGHDKAFEESKKELKDIAEIIKGVSSRIDDYFN